MGRSEGSKRRWKSSPNPCPAPHTNQEQVLSKEGEHKVIFSLAYPLGQSTAPEIRTLSLGPMIQFTFLAGHSKPLPPMPPGSRLQPSWRAVAGRDPQDAPKPCTVTPHSGGTTKKQEVGLSPDSWAGSLAHARVTVVPPMSNKRGRVTCCSLEVKQSSSQTATGRAQIIY